MLTDQQRKRAFNMIILSQCTGMLTYAVFQNGFYLNYFSTLGISSATIALLFALPSFVGALLMLPFAFWSDRQGKMKLALRGQLLLVGSLVLMLGAGWFGRSMATCWVVLSLLIFCVGGSLQGASWFALLGPIVPPEIRGRFFGRLRVSFMTVSILFTLLITRVLKSTQSITAFQTLLGLIILAHIFRYFTYSRIPELENPKGDPGSRKPFLQVLQSMREVPGFNSFNAYIFLITLFSAGVPLVFGLMQKDIFGFTPAQITLMGTLFLAGSVGGNLVGGFMVDRLGTRFVFVFSHLLYALVMLSMLARQWLPWALPVHVGACSFMFSATMGINGIALTSEMLALSPASNKSLATSLSSSLFNLATALSGLFVSRSIGWQIFADEWTLLGRTFTAYDALLLAFAVMTLVMLATIGLVPKIVKKVQLMPGSGYPRI